MGKKRFEETRGLFERAMSEQFPDVLMELNVIERLSLRQPELFQEIAQYRYFLQLSRVEGLGLVPLEAMACGCLTFGFHGGGGEEYMIVDGDERNTAMVSRPDMNHFAVTSLS